MPIKDFRGGLNTRDSPFELQANESPDLSNVTISALVGQLEARKGKTRYDVSGLPNETVDYAKQCVVGNTGKRALMLSINGNIWFCNPAGEVKKLHAGTAGTVWDFEVYADAAFKDWIYCQNGFDTPQKWDAEAAATVEWKATIGAIPNGGVICVWENRMFVAQNQRIYFSEFGDPEATVKEYGFVDVRGEEDDLDNIQDLHVLGARLIVLKRRSVFFISSAVTMANRRIGGPGVWGRFQTVELEDKLYFFNPQGIWSTGGVEVSMESGSINNYFPKHLNKAALGTARLIATRDTYPRLMLSVATGANTVPDTLIEMVPHINFRRIGGRRYLLLPAFFLHTLPASALATWNPTGTEELLIGTGQGSNATAGKTTFPGMAITDSFERGNENPLSNGGAWVKGGSGVSDQLILSSDAVTFLRSAFTAAGRYTASGEVTAPAVEIEIITIPAESSFQVELYACVKAEAEFLNGYKVVFNSNGEILIQRRIAGAIVNFGPFITGKPLVAHMRLGVTVLEGKIKVWWNIAGKGWELIAEAADATYTKGYSGLGLFQISTEHPRLLTGINFRTAAITATATRLSSLFTSTTDEGTEITAYWHSSWMSLQGDEPKERIRRLNVELQGDGVLDVFTDFSELPRFSSTIPKGAAEGSEYRFARVRPETFGRFHSIKLRSLAGGQPFLVNAMEVVYRGGKEH